MPAARLSLLIRAATENDAAEMARLFEILGYPIPVATIGERLAAFTAAGEIALVAANQTRLVGLVTLHVTPVLHRPGPVGRLTSLVVDDSTRGQGVGRALVAAAEAIFRERGCAMIEVTSNERRVGAHAFYERLGYSRTSLRFAKTLSH